MNKFPKLNFPSTKLRARKSNGTVMVWDEVRRCFLVLTPEEWVRRHLVAMLLDGKHIPLTHIVEEYPIELNGQTQRADVVVLDKSLRPALLVECKAADVEIDNSVMAQAVRYNSVLGARHIMLTNGVVHRIFATEDGVNYTPLDSLPDTDIE